MRFIITFLCVLSICAACGNRDARASQFKTWKEQNGKIKILSTTGMINDIVQQIGRDHVDTLTLIQGDLDPHSYQLVKGDDEKLNFATIIFYNGLGLEHGPSLHKYLSQHKNAIALGDKISQQNEGAILHFNSQLDPHIWMDIKLWSKTIPFIVEALSITDPAHADQYKKNGETLTQQMLEQDAAIKKEMAEIPENRRYLVTSHDAFNYFTKAYLAKEEEKQNDWQKRFAAPEGLAPDCQLSTTDIQYIVDHVRTYQIHVLFPESNICKDSIRKIIHAGKEKGLDLKMASDYLYGDAMGKEGSDGDTYLKMMQHNADVIKKNL